MSENDPKVDQTPDEDPIYAKSLSKPIAFWTALLLLATVWMLWDEFVSRAPWKGYQSDFEEAYVELLDKKIEETRQINGTLQQSSEYTELLESAKTARESVQGRVDELQSELVGISAKIGVISTGFREARSKVQALRYQIEKASSEDAKNALREDLEALKAEPIELAFADGDKSFNFDELDVEYETLKKSRGEIQSQQAALLSEATAYEKELNTLVEDRMPELTLSQLTGLRSKMDEFSVDIRQIHVAEYNLIDRCETCHLGTREPLEITAEDMGGQRAFISHPRMELLETHSPDTFGCSTCHNGNGIGLVSVDKAHGNYKHWLHPLFPDENIEAGCLQCHQREIHLDLASTYNDGRDLFLEKGCWGCHRYEGYDSESDMILAVEQDLKSVIEQERALNKLVRKNEALANDPNVGQDQLSAALRMLDVEIPLQDTELAFQKVQFESRLAELATEKKRQGPRLKELKAKVVKSWLPTWIRNPREFRPDTKMPVFRLDEDEVQKIAAYLWQTADDKAVAQQAQGDAEKGKELLYGRGCLGCHAIEDGGQKYGGNRAANLSRVGEKANYDYLVAWIENPRMHNPSTIMPDLRLPIEEVRDIASFLMTQKHADPPSGDVAFLDDQALLEEGRQLIVHYGCAGCHEIAGLEDEGRIGTELTYEGSKPIDRLDFGLITRDAKRGIGEHRGFQKNYDEGHKWYTHKAYFEEKLHNPDRFDMGKEKANRLERLRMPNFGLSEEQIDALVTMLLGSLDTQIPEGLWAAQEGDRQAITEGWWIVKKYNCQGCHPILSGDEPPLWTVPGLREDIDEEFGKHRAPSLAGQGLRTDPDWLASFLHDPSLGRGIGNGVRRYATVRMPTFELTDTEIGKLAKFFQAMSRLKAPYIPERVPTPSAAEIAMAKDMFVAQECAKCHAESDVFTKDIIAPSFVLTPARLQPRWVRRWLLNPGSIMPGTKMPTGLFKQELDADGNFKRWVMAAQLPESMRDYDGDHVELLTRYLAHYNEATGSGSEGQ